MPQSYVNMTGIGTKGMNTDRPPWAVEPQQAADMTDVVIYEGVATQRRGWENYLAATPASGIGGAGTYSITPLNGELVSVVDCAGTLYTHSDGFTSGAWEQVIDLSSISAAPQYVPRAQYQDEILLCDQTGRYPMLRTMGRYTDAIFGLVIDVPAHSALISVSGTGTAPISGASVSPASVVENGGSYIYSITDYDMPSLRVVKRDSGDYTVKNIDFASASGASSVAANSGSILMFGTTWPTVEVYSDGLASWTSGSVSVSVEGGGLSTGSWGKVFARSGSDLLVPLTDSIRSVVEWDEFDLPKKWSSRTVTATTDTTLTVSGPFANLPSGKKAPYSITRRSPFREVEAHQECLWGTGVDQYPSRVYYSPPGWDMQTPPELAQPWNGITDFYSPTEGLMRYTDVDGAGDGDKVMALLSSDGPLLIITQRACFGAYGTWPNFRREMIAAGAGCIDTRSAVSVAAYGQFWCGPDGIYGYRRGRVTDLTSERINELWRQAMRKYDADTGSYVVAGIANGHLVVSAHLTRDGISEDMTLGLNIALGSWARLSNMAAKAMHNPAIWSEKETLIAALDGSAQLVDLLPAFDMTGGAADADGTKPQLEIVGGSAVDAAGDPDGESRLVEVRIGGIVDDSSDAAPSSLKVIVDSHGAVAQGDTTSTTTGVLAGEDSGLIRRERLRIGNAGRTHQVTVQTAATSPDNRKIAIAEIGMNVRKRRIPR